MDIKVYGNRITLVCRDIEEAKEYKKIVGVIKAVKEAEEQRHKEALGIFPELETKIPPPEAQEIPQYNIDWDKEYANVKGTEGEPETERKTLIKYMKEGIEKPRRRRIKEPLKNPGEELKEHLEEPMPNTPDLTPPVKVDMIEEELLNQKRHKEELKARFCFGCGTEIKIRGKFCINCGTDIRDIA